MLVKTYKFIDSSCLYTFERLLQEFTKIFKYKLECKHIVATKNSYLTKQENIRRKGYESLAKKFFGTANLSEIEIKAWRNTFAKNRKEDDAYSQERQKKLNKRMKELGL